MKQTFLVSDESVNSNGFSVATEGIDLTNFKKNPIMLYMHERPNIIGRWENLEKKDGKLYADAVFDIEDQSGKEIARKVEKGFLRGASIGIVELEREGNIITMSELMEISIVDMGSNTNALKLYKDDANLVRLSFSKIQSAQSLVNVLGLEKTAGTSEIIQTVKDIKASNTTLKKEFEDFKKSIELKQKEEAKHLTRQAIFKKIIPKHFEKFQLMAFDQNFDQAKIEIQNLIEENDEELITKVKHGLVKSILNNSISKKQPEGAPVNKAEWTLSDYRKFSPEELENNPELFKELINKHYN